MKGKAFFFSTMEDKLRLQRATERYHDQIFEEIEERCRKSTNYEDIRMRGMKQEGCRDLETQEG